MSEEPRGGDVVHVSEAKSARLVGVIVGVLYLGLGFVWLRLEPPPEPLPPYARWEQLEDGTVVISGHADTPDGPILEVIFTGTRAEADVWVEARELALATGQTSERGDVVPWAMVTAGLVAVGAGLASGRRHVPRSPPVVVVGALAGAAPGVLVFFLGAWAVPAAARLGFEIMGLIMVCAGLLFGGMAAASIGTHVGHDTRPPVAA